MFPIVALRSRKRQGVSYVCTVKGCTSSVHYFDIIKLTNSKVLLLTTNTLVLRQDIRINKRKNKYYMVTQTKKKKRQSTYKKVSYNISSIIISYYKSQNDRQRRRRKRSVKTITL